MNNKLYSIIVILQMKLQVLNYLKIRVPSRIWPEIVKVKTYCNVNDTTTACTILVILLNFSAFIHCIFICIKSDNMTSLALHDWTYIAKCHKNYLSDNQSIYWGYTINLSYLTFMKLCEEYSIIICARYKEMKTHSINADDCILLSIKATMNIFVER